MKCSDCKQELSESAFARNRSRSRGRQSVCRDCFRRRYRKLDPETNRKRHIRRYYGLEWAEYLDMLQKQNGACAICGDHLEPLVSNKLIAAHVDHNHRTGKTRGLLCHFCNSGLGYFKDSDSLLRKAVEYLKHHG